MTQHPTLADRVAANPDLWRIAEQHARMVEIAILKCDEHHAHKAVDAAFVAVRTRLVMNDKTWLAEVLPPKLVSLLDDAGIRKVGQLCKMTETELREISQIADVSVAEIAAQLAKFGRGLRKI